MEKAVIVGQLDVSIANEKQLNGFPDKLGNPGDFVLERCLRNQCEKAVGGMPVA